MAYTQIIFTADDAWAIYAYSFKINMICRELSIEYKDNRGNYNMKGIKLNSEQIEHINDICAENIVEKYRTENHLKEAIFPLDPNLWKLQIMSDDGNSILQLEDRSGKFYCPDFLVELIEYVIDISAIKDRGFRLF